MSAELAFSPKKYQQSTKQTVKTNENHMKVHRKSIIYLILNYLRDEGLFESVDTIISEAHLTSEYEICDNMDLEMIVQEFSNYYFMKFNKYPNICKKNINSNNMHLTERRTEKSKKNKRQPCIGIQEKSSKNIDGSTPLDNLIVIKHFNNMDTSNDDCSNINEITEHKPFSKFLSTVSSDLKEIAENIFQQTKFDKSDMVTWESVKGLENAKRILQEAAVHSNKYPKLFSGLVSPWKGILLYGPPGSGKTMLVKALAYQSKRTFFNISPSTVLSKWRGESEKTIKILFDLARYYAPSIIFIDEIEALASTRDSSSEHEASRRLKSEILIELDGLGRSSASILFLATSNLPWEIDSALLRRLEKRLHIALPDEKERLDIFKSFLLNTEFNVKSVDFETLANKTPGYSGSDIRIICKEAAMATLRKTLMKMENKGVPDKSQNIIDQSYFEETITKVKPSAKHLAQKHIQWSESMGSE